MFFLILLMKDQFRRFLKIVFACEGRSKLLMKGSWIVVFGPFMNSISTMWLPFSRFSSECLHMICSQRLKRSIVIKGTGNISLEILESRVHIISCFYKVSFHSVTTFTSNNSSRRSKLSWFDLWSINGSSENFLQLRNLSRLFLIFINKIIQLYHFLWHVFPLRISFLKELIHLRSIQFA